MTYIHKLIGVLGVLFLSVTSCNSEISEGPTSENSILKPSVEEENHKSAVIAYLMAEEYEPNTIRWNAITHINVSFLFPNADGTLSDRQLRNSLTSIVNEARQHDVKVIVSMRDEVAGRFSAAIANHRSELADNLLNYVRDNNLDGFDIDYEDWTGSNTARNLIAFVKELYEKKDEGMIQTCAVNVTDRGYTKEWHKYFDYINIMAYDWHGPWNNEGQHSPYDESIRSVQFWENTMEAPAEKLVLGVPFYGYSWNDDDMPGKDYRYSQILAKYPDEDVAGRDQIDKLYYNGKTTIERKCNWAKENKIGGIMIWQIGQDAQDTNDSLLEAIGKIMIEKEE